MIFITFSDCCSIAAACHSWHYPHTTRMQVLTTTQWSHSWIKLGIWFEHVFCLEQRAVEHTTWHSDQSSRAGIYILRSPRSLQALFVTNPYRRVLHQRCRVWKPNTEWWNHDDDHELCCKVGALPFEDRSNLTEVLWCLWTALNVSVKLGVYVSRVDGGFRFSLCLQAQRNNCTQPGAALMPCMPCVAMRLLACYVFINLLFAINSGPQLTIRH